MAQANVPDATQINDNVQQRTDGTDVAKDNDSVHGLDEDDGEKDEDGIALSNKNIIKFCVPQDACPVKKKKEDDNKNADGEEKESKDIKDDIEVFSVTIEEARLCDLLSTFSNYYDFLKSSLAFYAPSIQESPLGRELEIPSDICRMIVVYSSIPYFLERIPASIMRYCVEYLQHHNGIKPEEIPSPVRSINMKQIVKDPWDATFMDQFGRDNSGKKAVFEIIMASNFLGINDLVHLACAKIATCIKSLSQKEINAIIEEEEKYRREQMRLEQQNDDVNENNANSERDRNGEDEDDDNNNSSQMKLIRRYSGGILSQESQNDNDNNDSNDESNVFNRINRSNSMELICRYSAGNLFNESESGYNDKNDINDNNDESQT